MGLNVKINNLISSSSVKGSEIHWICFGLDGAGTSANWSYVSVDGNGDSSLKKFSKGQDCTPLFNTVDKLSSFNQLPNMWSGQFLFTIGSLPKVFNIVDTKQTTNGGLGVQTPSFVPGSADADTIFVVVEFTYSGDIWCDCTIVDYFCAPVSIEVVGDTTKTNGIMKSGSNRESVFSKIKDLGTPWSNLIMQNKAKENVRVLGAQHGVEQGIIPTTIYDSYIDKCWDNFSDKGKNTLTINCEKFGTYIGTTNSTGVFTFKQNGKDDVIVNKPGPGKAYDIFGCVGVLNAPNDTPLGEIAAILGAELNRSMISISGSDIQPNCDIASFYSTKNGTTNEYSKVIHSNYKSGIYAFPFDDVCSTDSPLIQVSAPTELTINLSDWK